MIFVVEKLVYFFYKATWALIMLFYDWGEVYSLLNCNSFVFFFKIAIGSLKKNNFSLIKSCILKRSGVGYRNS